MIINLVLLLWLEIPVGIFILEERDFEKLEGLLDHVIRIKEIVDKNEEGVFA